MHHKEATNLRTPLILALLAAIAFLFLFRLKGCGILDFWWALSLIIFGLSFSALVLDRDFCPHLMADLKSGLLWKTAVGLASALLLYLAFFAGNYLSRLIFPFAGDNIENVYSLKQGTSSLRIIVLMVLIIGPGEEIFWRAFLQCRCMQMWGALPGTLAAVALYTAVHLSSLNIMLLIAALVCGSFWGALYWRFRSPLLNMVSHTAWDIMVFVLVPFL